MKKLAIMFVMLLGSVATMQAQSFDFSCSTITAAEMTAQSNTDFDIFQAPLFVEDQMTTLEVAGFNQGRQGFREDGVIVYYNDINHYAINVQLTADSEPTSTGFIRYPGARGSVRIDAESNGLFVVTTVNPDAIIGNNFTFDQALEIAMEHLALLEARSFLLDDDDNGFANAEDVILSDATFNEASTGIYNYSFDDGSSYIELSITTRDDVALPFVLDGEDLQDADGNYTPRSYHATLEDAMDYILMTYPSIFN